MPARRRTPRAQRGFIATLLLTPFLVALLAWPLVAGLTTLKVRQKALDAEVAYMLKRTPIPTGIAEAAQLEAEVEAAQSIRF